MADGVGVETFADLERRIQENKVVNGKSFCDALQEVENYTLKNFRVPTRAALMARKQFNLSPKTRFQAAMDARALARKRAIDNRIKKGF